MFAIVLPVVALPMVGASGTDGGVIVMVKLTGADAAPGPNPLTAVTVQA